MRLTLTIIACCLFLSQAIFAQNSIVGKWKTIDDETGEARSIVEIFEKNESLYGKVVKILDPAGINEVCTKCQPDDPRKNQKILGMEIIDGLKKDGKYWDGGKILDPLKGKVYKCRVWLENGDLMVRGYIGYAFIGRTQKWLPIR
ncbi:MAG: DUF2147 domain-containing protein [Cyclobacteriaceae bacterium]